MLDGMTAPDQSAPEKASDQGQDTTALQAIKDEGAEASETGEPEDAKEASEADAVEDVDYAGKTYKVPKDLKSALMMHADYTRKTQELSDQRRGLDSERDAFTKQVEAQRQHIAEVGRFVAIEQRLAQYGALDWGKLAADAPLEAQRHWMIYQQLKDQRTDLARKLEEDVRSRQFDAQQAFARRIEESRRVLAREIKGWNAETASKLVDFAKRNGLTEDDITRFEDNARMVKLLHQAWLGDQVVSKQRAAAQEAKPSIAREEAPKPLTQVGKGRTSAPPIGLADNLSTEEWVKRRNEQLRKRN